jgi:hypothetical protein
MRKDINFLEAYKIYYKYDKRKALDSYTLLLLCIITVVIMTSGFLHFYSIYAESKSVEVFTDLEDLKNITEYDYTVFKKLDYDNFIEYNLMLEETRQKLETISALSLREYNAIKKNLHEDMGIMSLSFSGDVISAKIFTSYQESVPEYVFAVKNEDIFKYVTYDGYAKEVFGEEHTQKIYVFTITCILDGEEKNEIE